MATSAPTNAAMGTVQAKRTDQPRTTTRTAPNRRATGDTEDVRLGQGVPEQSLKHGTGKGRGRHRPGPRGPPSEGEGGARSLGTTDHPARAASQRPRGVTARRPRRRWRAPGTRATQPTTRASVWSTSRSCEGPVVGRRSCQGGPRSARHVRTQGNREGWSTPASDLTASATRGPGRLNRSASTVRTLPSATALRSRHPGVSYKKEGPGSTRLDVFVPAPPLGDRTSRVD